MSITMAARTKKNARVGIRELRQNLSVYLRRVRKGERLEVTEHGQPVALLTPLPKSDSVIERLIAEGRCTRPQGDLLDLPPPLPPPPGWRPSEEVLAEMREDKI